MAAPLVTVVIPTYNAGPVLAECLQSIQAQSFTGWRCIVVDDGSTADDPGLLVAGSGPGIIELIRHDANRGLAAARNTGIRAATTEWVLPVDADDCLDPTFLEETLRTAATTPETECVHTNLQLFGGSTGVWRYPPRTPKDMAFTQWIPGPGTLYRRTVWSRCGGYDESPLIRMGGNEDWEFWIASVKRGLRSVHIDRELYFYRRGPSSISVTSGLLHDHRTRWYIANKHREFFREHGARRTFIAQGLLRSSQAWFERGRRLLAIRLAARGVLLQPGNAGLWHALGVAVVPEWVKVIRRRLRRRG